MRYWGIVSDIVIYIYIEREREGYSEICILYIYIGLYWGIVIYWDMNGFVLILASI